MTAYEPGTVAAFGKSIIGWHTSKGKWVWPDGSSSDAATIADAGWRQPRPLAVIDPEDREQVSVLARSLGRLLGDIVTTSDMQAALREFAEPQLPKPDEPTGLGAVVEATCQCGGPSRFVYEPESDRFEMWTSRKGPWKSACGHHEWSDLTAVEILSEGVPS